MTIFLVGMPGSGKSAIGKQLAATLQLPFFDTDQIIADIEDASITAIFAKHGEAYFRKKEVELISNWKLTNVIVATGGGLPTNPKLMEILNQKGTTIWVKSSVNILKHRLINNQNERPLVKNKSDKELEIYIKSTLKLRSGYYKLAILKVINNDEDIEVTCKRILKKLYT